MVLEIRRKFYFAYSFVLFVLFFPAILAHELAHFISALILGLKPSFPRIKTTEEGLIEISVMVNETRDWREIVVYLSPYLVSFIWLILLFSNLNMNPLLSLYLATSFFFTLPSYHDIKEALKIIKGW